MQYEFDSSVLEVIDGVVDKLSRGNLSAANSELERVKSLIAKWYKLVRFADKSATGWTAIKEYESDELADDSEDEKKFRSAGEEHSSRSGRKNVNMALTALTVQLLTPNSSKVHLLVCPLAVHFLLISLFFFACSPFVGVSPNQQISALAADREASGRIL